MDSSLVHPSNHHSHPGSNLEKKVKELETGLGKIYIKCHHRNDSRNFITQSPFSNEILNEPIPHRFKITSINPYDGSTDPVDHLEGYNALMQL